MAIECRACHKEIKPNQELENDRCYQVRAGYLDENGEFQAEEDVAYFHAGCADSEIQF